MEVVKHPIHYDKKTDTLKLIIDLINEDQESMRISLIFAEDYFKNDEDYSKCLKDMTTILLIIIATFDNIKEVEIVELILCDDESFKVVFETNREDFNFKTKDGKYFTFHLHDMVLYQYLLKEYNKTKNHKTLKKTTR